MNWLAFPLVDETWGFEVCLSISIFTLMFLHESTLSYCDEIWHGYWIYQIIGLYGGWLAGCYTCIFGILRTSYPAGMKLTKHRLLKASVSGVYKGIFMYTKPVFVCVHAVDVGHEDLLFYVTDSSDFLNLLLGFGRGECHWLTWLDLLHRYFNYMLMENSKTSSCLLSRGVVSRQCCWWSRMQMIQKVLKHFT